MEGEIQRPEETQHEDIVEGYRRRGRWILPSLLVLAIVGVAIPFNLRPAYRWLKEQRGEVLASEAREAMEAGNFERAMSRIRTAVPLAPKSLAVARITAEMCDLYGVPESLGFWQTVVSSPKATQRDRQRFVAAALNFGREDLAQAELAALVKADESDIENIHLSIRFLRQRGDVEGAIIAARRGIDLHPTNNAPKLALASLLASHPSPVYRDEGRERLRKLAGINGPVRLEALQILAQDLTISRAEKEKIAEALTGLSQVRIDALLTSLSLRLELAPQSRPVVLAEASGLVVSRTNSQEVVLALRWLYEHGASSNLLESLPLERARTNSSWTFWYLSALGAVGRWSELEPLLEDKTLLLPLHRRFGLLAAAADSQGNREVARNHLDSAIGAAHGQPEEQQRLARLAEQMGAWDMAMRGWVELLDFPPLARGAAQQVLRLSEKGDRPELVILAARRLLSLAPDDLVALNELAYTLLIEGRRDVVVEKQLLKAASSPRVQPGLWVTVALLHLQDNRLSEALDALENHGLKWDPAPTRWRLIYAASLAANQQRESAKKMASTIHMEALKQAEQRLAARWL
jgi:tetratricopeptide (TPR) repeat protein